MAETDGTPRFRKSKPPNPNSKGGANGRNTSSRNTRPNGKARKRGGGSTNAGLNATLPHGPALGGTAAEATVPETKTAEAAPVKAENRENSDVIKTMPTVIRTEPAAADSVAQRLTDSLADTHTDLENSGSRSKLQRGPTPATLRGKRPLLASTLRMELTVHRSEGAEPQISVRPTPGWSDGPQETSGLIDAGSKFSDGHDGVTTLPGGGGGRGEPRSRKPTSPGGYSSTFDDLPGRPARNTHQAREYRGDAQPGDAQPGDQRDHEFSQPQLGETVRRGSDISGNTIPSMNTARPRRTRRPGERTLIMTRRDKTPSSKRDWLFVVMLVAALGLTASMFLSRQAPPEEVVDAAAYDDPQYEDEQQPDPFATTLQPYKAKPAAPTLAAAPPTVPTENPTYAPPAHAAQTESSISASTIQATELRSLPSGAEVVAGDAVVGSTPVRVARGSVEMTYTLRLPGHQPKVVRVGPQSPASIMVELTRVVSGTVQPAEVPASALGKQ